MVEQVASRKRRLLMEPMATAAPSTHQPSYSFARSDETAPAVERVAKRPASERVVDDDDDDNRSAQLEALWQQGLRELREFKRRVGHCRVPKRCKQYPRLANWSASQRQQYGRGKLSSERVALLEEEGFEWAGPVRGAPSLAMQATYKGKWVAMLNKLKEFVRREGHCQVPSDSEDYPKLYSWLVTQRSDFRKGVTKPELLAMMQEAGLVWVLTWSPPRLTAREKWMAKLEELREFKLVAGHCEVEMEDKKTAALGAWVGEQREQRRKGRLSAELVALLEAEGFTWGEETAKSGKNNMRWAKRLQELSEFADREGHCRVPRTYAKNPGLGRWVVKQRTKYRHGLLETERVAILEDMGFEWGVAGRTWCRMFQELQEYTHRVGDCMVPRRFRGSPELGRWVSHQKKQFLKGALSAERVERLKELGFEFQPLKSATQQCLRLPHHTGGVKESTLERRGDEEVADVGEKEGGEAEWAARLEELREFSRYQGHCAVPLDYEDNPTLGAWVSRQRRLHRAGRLGSDAVRMLGALGFWAASSRSGLSDTPEQLVRAGGSSSLMSDCDEEDDSDVDEDDDSVGDEDDDVSEAGAMEMWTVMFREMLGFRKVEGHCRVPVDYATKPELGEWVKRQRELFYACELDRWQLVQLEGAGFEWDPRDNHWWGRFEELKRFKRREGHCRVPQGFEASPAFSGWVHDQRVRFHEGRLSVERRDFLEGLGFDLGHGGRDHGGTSTK
jgi:cation transport regulator ChaC